MPVKVLPRSQKNLLRLTKSKTELNDIDDNDDGPAGPEELDVHVPYKRPKLIKHQQYDDNEELSEYVQIRLLIIRAKVLKRLNEIQSSKA